MHAAYCSRLHTVAKWQLSEMLLLVHLTLTYQRTRKNAGAEDTFNNHLYSAGIVEEIRDLL